MIDSHCHLADEVFTADLDAVINRARAAGVGQGLCILAADDPVELGRGDRLSTLWPAIRFAVGVHPHHAGRFAERPEQAARAVADALSSQPAARAIGEIGLDYQYDFSPRDVQQEVFRHQLRLARAKRLPVVIHTREAEADTLAILREEGLGESGGIFHCFTGERTMARDVLDLGFHISFAGIVTFPRADALREVARVVPADRLLVETDAPYLAPVPHRGRRNEPAWVQHVATAVARARGEPVQKVVEASVRAFVELVRA